MILVRVIEQVGHTVVVGITDLGRATRLWFRGMLNLFWYPVRFRETLQQLHFVGVQSMPIIVLTSFFTGAVFAYQSYEAFKLFGAQGLVGGTVGVSLTRELGPTLTGLLVAGRAGSAMAAEIGTMRVTEQIDALDAMAVDPINYLVKPRLVASTLAVPLLTAIYDFIGCVGAWVVSIYVLRMSEPEFMVRLLDWVDWDDIWGGLLKGAVFGMIIGTTACYKGFYTSGGARGVGIATTSAVVVSSVLILVSNYFIAIMLPAPV